MTELMLDPTVFDARLASRLPDRELELREVIEPGQGPRDRYLNLMVGQFSWQAEAIGAATTFYANALNDGADQLDALTQGTVNALQEINIRLRGHDPKEAGGPNLPKRSAEQECDPHVGRVIFDNTQTELILESLRYAHTQEEGTTIDTHDAIIEEAINDWDSKRRALDAALTYRVPESPYEPKPQQKLKEEQDIHLATLAAAKESELDKATNRARVIGMVLETMGLHPPKPGSDATESTTAPEQRVIVDSITAARALRIARATVGPGVPAEIVRHRAAAIAETLV